MSQTKKPDAAPDLNSFIEDLAFDQPPRDFRCSGCDKPMEDKGAELAWCSVVCMKAWEKTQ